MSVSNFSAAAEESGEPILSFDPELNRALCRTNNKQNPTNLGNGINRQLPPPVDAHNQVIVENPGDCALRRQPPAPRPQDCIGAMLTSPILMGLLSYLL